MADFVLRNVRLVDLGGGAGGSARSTCIVERDGGRDRARARPAGRHRGVRRAGALGDPGSVGRARPPRPVDRAPRTGSTWPARGRPREALARVSERLGDRPGPLVAAGHRTGLWAEQPTVAALDAIAPDVPVVLIAGDAPPRLAQPRALVALGLPDREGVVTENEWFEAYTRLRHDRRARRDPGGVPSHARAGRRARRHGGRRPRARARPAADWEPRDSPVRVRVATYADGLDDVIAPGLRSGDCCPGSTGPGHDGAAQDHQRRLAQHPDRLVLRARTPTGSGAGAAQPDPRRAAPPARPATAHGLEVATHAIGDLAVREALARTPRPARAARSSTPSWYAVTTCRRMAGSACGPASSRPTCSTTATPPSAAGRTGATAASRSGGCSTRASTWRSAPTPRSRGSTRGWPIAAAVHRSADDREPWQPEQALTSARRWPRRRRTGQGPRRHAGRPRPAGRGPAGVVRRQRRAGGPPPGDAGGRHLVAGDLVHGEW